MNPAEANGGQRLPGLAGELPGGQGRGPHAVYRLYGLTEEEITIVEKT